MGIPMVMVYYEEMKAHTLEGGEAILMGRAFFPASCVDWFCPSDNLKGQAL